MMTANTPSSTCRPGDDPHRLHNAGERRDDAVLHLHGLEAEERIAFFDMRARHDGDGDDAAVHRRNDFAAGHAHPRGRAALGSGKTTRSWRPRSSTKASRPFQTISASRWPSATAPPIEAIVGPRRDHSISATAGSPSTTTSRLDFRRRPVSSKASVRAQGPAASAAETSASRAIHSETARAARPRSSGCADKLVKPSVDEAGVDAAGPELRRSDDGGEEREIGLRTGDAGAAERTGQSRQAPPRRSAPCAMTLPSIAS